MKHCRWKTGQWRAFWLGVAAAVANALLPALGVDITWQSSQVRGEWLELWSEPEGNARGEAGVFRHHSSDASMLFWRAASEPFGWSAAQGALGPFSLWMTAYSAPSDLPMAGGAMGNLAGSGLSVAAESRTRFVASAPTLAFTLQAEAYWNYSAQEQDMSLVLRDLTLDEVLLRWQLADHPEATVASSYSFTINPAHEYEMILSGWVNAWDAKDAWLRLWVGWDTPGGALRIARVPDAGSTAALLILGAGGLWALRRVWRSPSS
ncbi:VPDSG-CTERM sorting domain-containing protein [Limisphaera sp. VF-2]|uniref:VPDSG-CTERM sorting domain-containing protein n=1 Tax=Limisphaera sp. VF-2 TaxID=3400418 RepID=UPI003C290C2C